MEPHEAKLDCLTQVFVLELENRAASIDVSPGVLIPLAIGEIDPLEPPVIQPPCSTMKLKDVCILTLEQSLHASYLEITHASFSLKQLKSGARFLFIQSLYVCTWNNHSEIPPILKQDAFQQK